MTEASLPNLTSLYLSEEEKSTGFSVIARPK